MKEKISYDAENNQQVDKLIGHINSGYTILGKPTILIKDGQKITGSYRGYEFGSYTLVLNKN